MRVHEDNNSAGVPQTASKQTSLDRNIINNHVIARTASKSCMSTWKTALVGGIAGLAGAQVMQWFRTAWNDRHAIESGVFGLDREADVRSIQMLASKLFGRSVNSDAAECIALGFHYGYGAAAGAAYAVAAERWPAMRAGLGTAFGVFVWIFGDEVPIWLTGVSDPRLKTAESHGSALIAHLLFGAVTDAAMRQIIPAHDN